MNKSILLLAVVLASALCAEGAVKLPSIICDNMVVQRDKPLKLWGTADPGETVSIDVYRLGKKKKALYKKPVVTTADAQGNWIAEAPALPLGSTYEIQINDLMVGNVVPGDVFLCSGQSNMELPVARVTDMFADEIASYENPDIRHFNVPSVVEFHKKNTDIPASAWAPCTQQNVMAFSALAYFFAKELYAQTGVPVGLINSSWGGTPIEAWIAEEYLTDYPLAINEKRLYEDDGYRQRIKKLEGENYAQWERAMYRGDLGVQEPVKWYDPDYDDSAWEEVDMLSTEWATDGLNPVNGSHWWRKTIDLDPEDASADAVLRMGCIVDADSVYVNGLFVGNITYQYPPRIYRVPAEILHPGKNVVTVRMISQNGFPHFVAEKPYKLIAKNKEYSLEGKWRHKLGARMPHGPAMEFYCYKPTVLYNAMIHPLANVPLAGAIWYQGESNVDRRNQYADLLQIMMRNWRETFNDESLPFYIVELAGFLHPSDVAGRAAWAELRQQQAAAAAATDNATLIPNSDLGEWNDIHPLDKKTLARRIVSALRSAQ